VKLAWRGGRDAALSTALEFDPLTPAIGSGYALRPARGCAARHLQRSCPRGGPIPEAEAGRPAKSVVRRAAQAACRRVVGASALHKYLLQTAVDCPRSVIAFGVLIVEDVPFHLAESTQTEEGQHEQSIPGLENL
jgi:hypothetical protein